MRMSYKHDYYSILGILENATSDEIKIAYRKLSKKLHPDVNGGDKFYEKHFQLLNEAYQVLNNKIERAKYDSSRENIYKKTIDEQEKIITNLKIDIELIKKNLSKEKNSFNKIIERKNEEIQRLKSRNLHHSKNDVKIMKLFIVGLLIAFVIIFSYNMNTNKSFAQNKTKMVQLKKDNKLLTNLIEYTREKNQRLSNLVDDTKFLLTTAQEKLDEIATIQPIIIKKIDFENSSNKGIYSRRFKQINLKYIYPRLHIVTPLTINKSVKLYVNIYNPDGTLSNNYKISPKGHTHVKSYQISPNTSLLGLIGWGNDEGTAYIKGKHKVEIWYEGKMIGKEYFTVY